jgi:hypothetical protein
MSLITRVCVSPACRSGAELLCLRGLGMRYVSQEEDSLRSGLGGVRGMRTMYEI